MHHEPLSQLLLTSFFPFIAQIKNGIIKENLGLISVEVITFIALLLIASFIDLKKKEVYDILTIGTTLYVLTLSLIYSIILGNFYIVIYSLIIGIIIFLIGYVLYLTGMNGGGDVKIAPSIFIMINLILMIIAKNYNIKLALESFGLYMLIFIIVNFLYGCIVLVFYILKHYKKVFNRLRYVAKKYWQLLILILVLSAIVVYVLKLFGLIIIVLLIILILILLIKDVVFVKTKSVNELSVGDWLVNNVQIKGKIIRKKGIGLSEDDIKRLKELNVRYVKVREGFALIPVFTISFIIFMIFLVMTI